MCRDKFLGRGFSLDARENRKRIEATHRKTRHEKEKKPVRLTSTSLKYFMGAIFYDNCSCAEDMDGVLVPTLGIRVVVK